MLQSCGRPNSVIQVNDILKAKVNYSWLANTNIFLAYMERITSNEIYCGKFLVLPPDLITVHLIALLDCTGSHIPRDFPSMFISGFFIFFFMCEPSTASQNKVRT